MAELVFKGLDGSSLLGFMAALGVLRCTEGATLSWRVEGCWIPSLQGDFSSDPQQFSQELTKRLLTPEWCGLIQDHDDSNKISQLSFRKAAEDSRHDRNLSEWVAAIGCDGISSEGLISDTAFRTMSGAGHQHFLKTFRELKPITNAQQIYHCLFEDWTYQDGKPGLRFDAAEDRRYALRWNEPSTDPVKTVRGANRLAVEAIPLFPTVPVGKRLETTGFRGHSSRDTWFAWPLWLPPLSLEVVRCLLSHPYLHQPQRRPELQALGVAEVYRSRRLTLGKMRNFAPAVPLGDAPVSSNMA